MHNRKMKTAALPSLRVAPQLRDDAERLLREGETLSSFMSEALTQHVLRRKAQDEFIERGLASAFAARQSGSYVSAETVLNKLEAKLAKHRTATRARTTKRSAK